MKMRPSYSIKLIMVIIIGVPLDAVTVNPALCPTNKIAPHRRSAGWDEETPRTFGAYYDLLFVPSNQQQFAPQSSLQEEPQKDELDDCGDIEDYDENDLSSFPQSSRDHGSCNTAEISGTKINIPKRVTAQSNRRYGYDGRLFFGHLFNQQPHGQYPDRPTNPNGPNPVRPTRPSYSGRPTPVPPPNRPNYPPVRPPYWSGGYFGNNPYRPPSQQHPSDSVKPVHEDSYHEPEMTYRPDVVGGPSGHVVGVRPTKRPATVATSTGQQNEPTYVRFPKPTQGPGSAPVYTTRRPRPRKLNYDDGLFGSFIDLLF